MSTGGSALSAPGPGATAMLHEAVARLADLLDRETACLLAGEVDAVLDVCAEKEAAFADLERIANGLRDRTPGPTSSGPTSSGPTSSGRTPDTGPTAPDAGFEALEPDADRRAALRDALVRCAERNLANGRILARLRRSNEQALALLTGRNAQTLGYAAGGAALRTTGQRTLARA